MDRLSINSRDKVHAHNGQSTRFINETVRESIRVSANRVGASLRITIIIITKVGAADVITCIQMRLVSASARARARASRRVYMTGTLKCILNSSLGRANLGVRSARVSGIEGDMAFSRAPLTFVPKADAREHKHFSILTRRAINNVISERQNRGARARNCGNSLCKSR